jgi:hypothetical protein
MLAACSAQDEFPQRTHEEFSASAGLVAQSCTSLNARRLPAKGTFCGGSSHAFDCTPGAMYNCNDKSPTNNCTLTSVCANGCQATDTQGDGCFNGTPSLLMPVTSLPGGQEVSATVNLTDSHAGGGIVNLRTTRLDLVAGRFSCNVPQLGAGQNTATWAMPTAVVASPTVVNLYTDISYTDARNVPREIVSPSFAVTLQPGGTAPPPPAVTSFTLTPSTVAAGGVSLVDATLEHMAPVNGQQVNITSSDPTVASVIPGGQPLVLGGCTVGGGAETIQASKQVAATQTVTIGAASAGSAQAPVSSQLTVNAGCSPKTCVDLAMPLCQGPDGCGGTLQCGCSFGEVCGGGGPGICGTGTPPPGPTPVTLTGLTLSPSSCTAGSAVIGTVTLSDVAPVGGAVVALSSSGSAATAPASITIPAGFNSGSFTITTNPITASTAPVTVTLTATLGSSQSATLTVSPKPAPAGATLSLTATGRSGVTISSSPAGLSVPVGQAGSQSFAAGSTITLSASDGRTVIWSGACTASRDTNSCTFTLNGDASVNANVR